MTVPRRLLDEVASRLATAGCVAAEDEARELLALHPAAATLEGWLGRRERGEPLAWITGSVEFCGRRVAVAPGVYVPRWQTEELARRAGRLLPDRGRAADLCTGAGAVAATLAAGHPAALVVGTDLDERATACARRNGVRAVVADLGDGLAAGRFDVVTAVAPYVPTAELAFLPADVRRHEPRPALDGGPDGLAVVRRCVVHAARLLRPGGWLLAEVGGDQDRRLAPLLAASGFTAAHPWWDEDGDLRGIAARLVAGRAR